MIHQSNTTHTHTTCTVLAPLAQPCVCTPPSQPIPPDRTPSTMGYSISSRGTLSSQPPHKVKMQRLPLDLVHVWSVFSLHTHPPRRQHWTPEHTGGVFSPGPQRFRGRRGYTARQGHWTTGGWPFNCPGWTSVSAHVASITCAAIQSCIYNQVFVFFIMPRGVCVYSSCNCSTVATRQKLSFYRLLAMFSWILILGFSVLFSNYGSWLILLTVKAVAV